MQKSPKQRKEKLVPVTGRELTFEEAAS